jgi:hypothetical protein
MYWIISFTLFIISSAWAQKSPELDQFKASLSKLECERLVNWKLVDGGDSRFSAECDIDALHFYTNVKNKSLQDQIRIGNFNLLHPGTDKTLFKDFKIVAQLINKEFDIMAAIELVDVVADAKAQNLRIAPAIQSSFLKYEETYNELKQINLEIDHLHHLISTNNLNQDLEELHLRLRLYQKDAADIIYKLKTIEENIKQTRFEISELQLPGLTLFGIEVFKNRRIKKLNEKEQLLSQLVQDHSLSLKSFEHINLKIKSLETTIANTQQGLQVDIAHLEAKLSDLKNISVQTKIKLTALELDFSKQAKKYRVPGHITLLKELRKLDPHWSLIVSPHGDAAVETNTQELVGYYYRADALEVVTNQHCSTFYDKFSFACIPNLYESYMGENLAQLFSRRPFLASFKAKNEIFHMLASHVIFESPKDQDRQKQMLKQIFGKENLNELGRGINKDNYARFVEVAATLRLIDELKKEGLKNILFMGDLNLESKNQFWAQFINKYTHNQVLVNDLTSISETRFSQNRETLGLSSNYDHFILSEDERARCKNERSINFITNKIGSLIDEYYLVRKYAIKGPYDFKINYEQKIQARTQDLLDRWLNNGLIESSTSLTKDQNQDLANFNDRVFKSQLSDSTYYKMYVQLISDHLPIAIDCTF